MNFVRYLIIKHSQNSFLRHRESFGGTHFNRSLEIVKKLRWFEECESTGLGFIPQYLNWVSSSVKKTRS
jgi:hypothetical protein